MKKFDGERAKLMAEKMMLREQRNVLLAACKAAYGPASWAVDALDALDSHYTMSEKDLRITRQILKDAIALCESEAGR